MNYAEIEAGVARVDDLLSIPIVENGEHLVEIVAADGLLPEYGKKYNDMVPVLGKNIYVRRTVYEKLLRVAAALRSVRPSWALRVTYGYRILEIQQKYFDEALEICRKMGGFVDEKDLIDRAHWFGAHPAVAGHPTGGAVDVTLFDTAANCFVEMGAGVDDFAAGKKVYYASPEISAEAFANRKILRDLMTAEGFSPFDAEYWHFSYGDREWAWICKKTAAHYGQVGLEKVKGL